MPKFPKVFCLIDANIFKLLIIKELRVAEKLGVENCSNCHLLVIKNIKNLWESNSFAMNFYKVFNNFPDENLDNSLKS